MRRITLLLIAIFLGTFVLNAVALPSDEEAAFAQGSNGDVIIIVVDNFEGTSELTTISDSIDRQALSTLLARSLRAGIPDFETFRTVTAPVTRTVSQSLGLPTTNTSGVRGSNPSTSSDSNDAEGAFAENSHCTVTFDSQVFAVRDAGDDSDNNEDTGAEDDLTHGERVVQIIDEQLRAAGVEDSVRIVEIDMDDVSTTTIADGVSRALTSIPGSNVIVNMSFAIVPCEDLPVLAAAEAYVRQLQDDENYASIEAFQESIAAYFENLETLVRNDAVEDLTIERETPLGFAMFVGAAGNYGQDFPFLPSGWDTVLSISASDEYSSSFESIEDRAAYSNQGQIMLPLPPDSPLGTSFTAPRMTALIAILIAQNNSAMLCGTQDLSALLSLDYEDMTLSEAFGDVCSDALPLLNQLALVP